MVIAAINRENANNVQVYEDIKCLPYWDELAARFFKHVDKAARSKGYGHTSVSVEYCLNGTEVGTVHLHAMISGGQHRLCSKFWNVFTFDGYPVAHVVLSAAIQNRATATSGRSKRSGSDFAGCVAALRRAREAHFYLQFPKSGMLAQQTNFKKNDDFPFCRK